MIYNYNACLICLPAKFVCSLYSAHLPVTSVNLPTTECLYLKIFRRLSFYHSLPSNSATLCAMSVILKLQFDAYYLSFAKSFSVRSLEVSLRRDSEKRTFPRSIPSVVSPLHFRASFQLSLCSEATACNSRVMRCQTALRGVIYIETRQSFRKEGRRPTKESSRISRPERDDDQSILFVFA